MQLTTGIIFVFIFVAIFLFLFYGSERKVKAFVLPDHYRDILQQHVHFYNHLYNADKREFEERMRRFLSTVRITGIKTVVEDIDLVFIAASAIIPIFGFKNWEYTNLYEVLVYPNAFDEEFKLQGGELPYGGMVGWGSMQNQMIISQQDLREGFIHPVHNRNTGIHEFVHLIDKGDGATDGLPENIIDKQYIVPWLRLMQKGIKDIAEGRSEINPYGATNEAEFFAVVSEYFFNNPGHLKHKHPELFSLLEQIFRQHPDSSYYKEPVKIEP